MAINRKKINHYNGLGEALFVGSITALFQYAHHLIEKGGIYGLLLMPLMELVKFSSYLTRIQEKEFNDTHKKTVINVAFKGLKMVASGAGAGCVVAGMATLGFGIMIVSGYMSVARNLIKAARSAIEGNGAKVSSNLHKAAVGGLISGGFTLMTFFMPLAWIGGIMVFIATGHLALTMLPGMIGEAAMPPLQVAQAAQPLHAPLETEFPVPNQVGRMFLPALKSKVLDVEEVEPLLQRGYRNSI